LAAEPAPGVLTFAEAAADGEALAAPDERPVFEPAEASTGTKDSDSVGATGPDAEAAPVSPEVAAPGATPGWPAFSPCTLRAARWAALPPQAAEMSNPTAKRTKRRRDTIVDLPT
jgi:hypothetical protein